MQTQVLKLDSTDAYRESIARAARALREGAIVALPTETVYGLAANAENPEAMAHLRKLKDRPDGPFTCFITSLQDVKAHVEDPPELAMRLGRSCWPGPLTLVLERADGATVGLRMPDCGGALDLLSEAAVPVAAPSANPRGKPPALTARDVLDYFEGEIEIVVDGGTVREGLASTVVKVSGDSYEVVRSGALSAEALRQAANTTILFVCTGNSCRSPIAEGLLKMMLAGRLGVDVDELPQHGYSILSAGTIGFTGAPASPLAAEVAREMGAEISSHRSRPLTLPLMRRADHIYCMMRGHLAEVIALDPAAADRASLLCAEGVPDPLGGSSDVYGRCARLIRQALETIVEEL